MKLLILLLLFNPNVYSGVNYRNMKWKKSANSWLWPLWRSQSGIRVVLLLLLWFPINQVDCCQSLNYIGRTAFRTAWKDTDKTIYDGDKAKHLLNMCRNGCTDCPNFPVLKPQPPHGTKACDSDDIKRLRQAQELVKGWNKAIKAAKGEIIIHGCMVGVSSILILILIVRGHYRFKDLWYLPTERKWQLETDPTWGLPGKVWSLLRKRVVKSDDTEPTKRKNMHYTENPTLMGDKYWSYKHALRDIYKSHKYYKRNRYFHKLAWQITKLGKVTPETLRRHNRLKRRAGEVDRVQVDRSPPPELDPTARLPLAVDLPNELNTVYLRKAKAILSVEVEKEKAARRFFNGRFQPHTQVGHHHHHRRQSMMRAGDEGSESNADAATAGYTQLPPLTFEEMNKYSKEMETDPNADFVMVNDIMKVNPAMDRSTFHHHHHHNES